MLHRQKILSCLFRNYPLPETGKSKLTRITEHFSFSYDVLQFVRGLSTAEGYKGYGPEQGEKV